MYVFVVIEHSNRGIRILGATAHPTACVVGRARRTESRHGPRGRRLPGAVADPGQGREVPCPVRRHGQTTRGFLDRTHDLEPAAPALTPCASSNSSSALAILLTELDHMHRTNIRGTFVVDQQARRRARTG